MKDSVVEKAKKVLGFIKPYIIKYYVAFFVGGLVWMLLDVYVTKGIDASFVSAVMDSIMAGTAILAVLAAKNYLAQFTAQEGYKIAISLVNDEILSIPKHGNVYTDYANLHAKIHEFNGVVIERSMIDELSNLQKTLIESRVELNECYLRIVEKKRKLDTYGIDIHKQKLVYYESMTGFLSLFLRECKDIEDKTLIIIEKIRFPAERNSYGYPRKDVFNIARFDFNEPIPNLKVINDYWLNTIYNYTEFRKNGSSITKLFKVYG